MFVEVICCFGCLARDSVCTIGKDFVLLPVLRLSEALFDNSTRLLQESALMCFPSQVTPVATLPQNTKDRFDQQLCRILASNHAQKDSMLLIWCFGIAALAEGIPRVAESHVASTESRGAPLQDPGNAQRSSPAARRLFESAKNMTKTTTMTVLSVIWACKSGVGVTDAEAAQGIRIAIRTLQSVDVDVRRGWLHSGSMTASMVPKLVEKSLRTGIHPSVQLEVRALYVSYYTAVDRNVGFWTSGNTSRSRRHSSKRSCSVRQNPGERVAGCLRCLAA